MKPVRIQLSRKKGWRKPFNTVVVSRPSKWGNIFSIKLARTFHPHESEINLAARCVRAFEAILDESDRREIRAELRGKNLACWCKLWDEKGLRTLAFPCHADVLLKIANA